MLPLAVAELAGCGKPAPFKAAEATITVAAAANLNDAFSELAARFKARTGVDVVFSFGSTAQLAQQIEHGAPFDVFASADAEHVDDLVRKGVLLPQSRALYARGRLAVWVPKGDSAGVQSLADLAKRQIQTISIATPSAAPYGEAAIESLRAAGLWPELERKVIYANNISMAKQFAATGNADAAFTAYSLVLHERGKVLLVDGKLHRKLDQVLGILRSSQHLAATQRFRQFVLGPQGRSVLERYGYELP